MITVKMERPAEVYLNIPVLVDGLIRLVDGANDEAHKRFKDTIKDFSSRSQFAFDVQRAKRSGSVISASTSTGNENYVRLNQGTDDHVVGQNRQLMSFLPVYHPKTRPFHASSRSGGPGGERQIARGPWRVRGIEPRAFDIAVYTLTRHFFFNGVDQVFRDALRVR